MENSKNIHLNYIISEFCFIINIIVSLYSSLKFFFVKWYFVSYTSIEIKFWRMLSL